MLSLALTYDVFKNYLLFTFYVLFLLSEIYSDCFVFI